ncbi:hypothetical protein PDE_09326 [Penicillium oxalicum 114-2]|uniref:Uncharacterized protein n=1 Tax=Penicillium oxalicum (strain 114-2 / CGMCC 5302) TaxID=933388 RepID=S8BGX9_PENO1|nr:hypothetical protein PDE_09326 [Penicillium oxalicum 114-2]
MAATPGISKYTTSFDLKHHPGN